MEHTSDTNPWQAPPAFLLQQLVVLLIERDLRWALEVACIRLVSRDWRAVLDSVLPVLAPFSDKYLVDYTVVAELVPRFPGLRYLSLQSPTPFFLDREAQVSALAAIGSSCTALRCLRLLTRDVRPEDLLCLSPLRHLAVLQLSFLDASLNGVAVGALQQLPRLRCLQVQCNGVDSEALATLGRLTSLRYKPSGRPNEAPPRLPALARLTRLRCLGLDGFDVCCASPELTHLAALPLTCLEIDDTLISEQDVSPALLELLHRLGASGSGSSSGGGSASGSSIDRRGDDCPGGLLRLRLCCDVVGNAAEPLPLSALAGLEALHIDYPGLEVSPPSQVSCLARLTELTLELRAFHQHEEEGRTVSALVAAVGRRLPALRQLSLVQAQRVSEAALVELSGLTQLTALTMLDAHDFGRRALAALTPLTSLRRLTLSHISLSLPGLEEGMGSGDEAEGPASDEEEEDECAFPPQLTYLALQGCALLSPSTQAHLVSTLPALQHFVHHGEPRVQQPQLECILRGCSQLQLLQTSWRPATAPPDGGAAAAPGAAGDDAADEAEQARRQMQQQRWQHDSDVAFCSHWRLKLDHSMYHDVNRGYKFDAAEALREAAAAGDPGGA